MHVFYTNPRYILFLHLVLNDMIQLTISVVLFSVAYIFYRISVPVCFFGVIAAVCITINTPLNLAAMAVERYIAVCFPLRHAELCTVRRTYILIVWIWVFSSFTVLFETIVLLSTKPLEFFHSTIYCLLENLFRHPISTQVREINYIIYLTVVWFTLFFTYFKIFFAAKAANSADGKTKKARNTILLHGFQLLLCMLTYVEPFVKNTLIRMFPKYTAHLRFVSYIIINILPRFISPIVYGLRDKTFKEHLKRNFTMNLFLLHNKV
ncbi:olfactory receptor 56A3-like [Austrofundulus limnaeus]|uniref:Olfactory receptor 56A3-like n=1 Tax=Austrofundulus limnaeus TaxID=52670 RepID=A0A2I4C3R9_AUSLI|nr:PREDICTED: olfactory receptor 56A3-like [Austrofundulus limnaeus]